MVDIDKLLKQPKIITCIVPVGMGKSLVDDLFHELNVNTGNVTRGRGASQRSGTFADEMDILTVVAEAERADEIFGYLYGKAEIGTTPHRFMYQSALNTTSLFTLPEMEVEND